MSLISVFFSWIGWLFTEASLFYTTPTMCTTKKCCQMIHFRLAKDRQHFFFQNPFRSHRLHFKIIFYGKITTLFDLSFSQHSLRPSSTKLRCFSPSVINIEFYWRPSVFDEKVRFSRVHFVYLVNLCLVSNVLVQQFIFKWKIFFVETLNFRC